MAPLSASQSSTKEPDPEDKISCEYISPENPSPEEISEDYLKERHHNHDAQQEDENSTFELGEKSLNCFYDLHKISVREMLEIGSTRSKILEVPRSGMAPKALTRCKMSHVALGSSSQTHGPMSPDTITSLRSGMDLAFPMLPIRNSHGVSRFGRIGFLLSVSVGGSFKYLSRRLFHAFAALSKLIDCLFNTIEQILRIQSPHQHPPSLLTNGIVLLHHLF